MYIETPLDFDNAKKVIFDSLQKAECIKNDGDVNEGHFKRVKLKRGSLSNFTIDLWELD